MNNLQKIKWLNELKKLTQSFKSKSLKNLEAIKTGKRIKELKALLGFSIKPNQADNVANHATENVDIQALYAFDDTKTKTQRQSDNNAVFSLLDKVDRGEVLPEHLTQSDKAILAKYSGSGGGLKSRDGKTGSAHEYYTPAPIASAMWKAIEEMGFSGGKVLDPCGGSGIFGAFAPKDSIVQAIEMDETSAMVNKLVNGSERYHVEVASFEQKANDIPDNSIDAIVTNVPFGDVSLRKHRNKDVKYQKENLQTYFVLRSLDKLRYGGLAAFIVPSSFLDGKGGKSVNARLATSRIAEFIGAYRLPNSVFGTAAADVATDIIFYRKYDKDVIDKIEELQEQNIDILKQANVFWDIYLDGKYFKLAQHKKFIFGEEGEIESWRTDADGNKKKVYAVINNDSVANIAQAIKRFQGSRIDWDLLEATETDILQYSQGDVVYQNGQAFVFDGIKFNAVETSENEAESVINDVLSKIQTPLMAFENKIKADDLLKTYAYLEKTNQYSVFPLWAKSLTQDLSVLDNAQKEKQFKQVLVGLSVRYVLDNFVGENHFAKYPELSEAMKERVTLDKKLNKHKSAIDVIKLHYLGKGVYSNVWKGIAKENEQVLSTSKKVERFKYLNGTLALPIDEVQKLGIDVLSDDDWCVNADGTEAIKLDDYCIGTLEDVLKKIDAELEKATDKGIQEKLLNMKQLARNRAVKIDTSNMQYSLRSPYVDENKVAEFVKMKTEQLGSDLKIRVEQSRAGGGFSIAATGGSKTDNDKLIKRICEYLETGNISHGGISLSKYDENRGWIEMSDGEKLTVLRDMITEWQAEFSVWIKADKDFVLKMESLSENPKYMTFPIIDDGSPLPIDGASDDFALHDYQNSFVRKMSREFAGINGFGVGLGKTVTALASAQYALETGTKKKVCFVVPNAVLSNWNKESKRYFKDNEKENCLFVGADIDKKGDFVVNSKNYARDLNRVLENKHNKIFMTQQAFMKIRMREETVEKYIDFLGRVDESFAEQNNASRDEKAQTKQNNLIAKLSGDGKLENAPFFEDLGFDALIIDEAHHFKNGKTSLGNQGVRGLPSGVTSLRAMDMSAKSWYLRGQNPRKDGTLLLTATPVTNSPIEIYTMTSLAIGEERVNNIFLGKIKGVDSFIETICDIQTSIEKNISMQDVSTRSLTGIKNLNLVKSLIGNSADMKSAEDVGASFKQVEAEDINDGIQLDDFTKSKLDMYKNAYSVARSVVKDGEVVLNLLPLSQRMAYLQVKNEFGTAEKVANAFAIIDKMNKALLDTELLTNSTHYIVDNENAEKAKKAVEDFNKGKSYLFDSEVAPDNTDLIKSNKTIKDADGNIKNIYTVMAYAEFDGEKIVLNSNDFNIQTYFEKLLEKHQVDASVSISPKISALLENIKKEQSHVRYATKEGIKQKFAKQIVFVESLAMHNKIKRLIVQKCDIPANRVTFISGQFNSSPDEIIEVQERFNGDNEDGYSIVIANKKAEVGINLQKGCQAIHHLEINWTPDSITQRNGRGVRQGNTAEKVNIYYYEADGTFDMYKRHAVSKKSNWIEQVTSKETSVKGSVEVAQALNQKDFEEILEFDGTKDGLQALIQLAEKRKQDEKNELSRKTQKIQINIIKNSNKWLSKYGENIKVFLTDELKEIDEINNSLTRANKKLMLMAETNKNYKKTQQEVQKLTDTILAYQEEWNKLIKLPISQDYLRIIESREVSKYNASLFYIDKYAASRYKIDSLDSSNPLVKKYEKIKEQNLAMRQSATSEAKQFSHVDNAYSDEYIEWLGKGFDVIEITDNREKIGYLTPNDLIISSFENEQNFAVIKPSEDEQKYNWHRGLFVKFKEGVVSVDNNYPFKYYTEKTHAYKICKVGTKEYIEALKLLAKAQSYLNNGLSKDKVDSIMDYVPEIADYIDESNSMNMDTPYIIHNTDVSLKNTGLYPKPLCPDELPNNASADVVKLLEEQKKYFLFNNRSSQIEFSAENKQWALDKGLTSTYGDDEFSWKDGINYLLDKKIKVNSLQELEYLIAKNNGYFDTANFIEDWSLISSFNHQADNLLDEINEKMKTVATEKEAIAVYNEFLQQIYGAVGLNQFNFADETNNSLYKIIAKNASSLMMSVNTKVRPIAVALSGYKTYGLFMKGVYSDKQKYNNQSGVRSYLKEFPDLQEQIAFIDKTGNSKSFDKPFVDYLTENAKDFDLSKFNNNWIVSYDVFSLLQEADSDFGELNRIDILPNH